MKHKKIFRWCFTASLLVHIMAAIFVERYSLWFTTQQKQESQDWVHLIEKKEKDEILKIAFTPSSPQEEVEPFSKPQKETFSLTLNPPLKVEEKGFANGYFFQTPAPFPLDNLLAASHALPVFAVPLNSYNLLDHLPKNLIVPINSKPSPITPSVFPMDFSPSMHIKPPVVQSEIAEAKLNYSETPTQLTEAPQIAKAPTLIPLPHLPTLPSLAELETSSYSDSFDADLVFFPKEEGGYIFALTLIPRPDLELPRIRQHVTFLIDKSNSIQQGRLNATKSAVYKALAELSTDDTFNIIAFDNKVEKMSPHFLPCNPKSFAKAEEFLEKIQLGSFFTSSDLYKPLFLTVPGQVGLDELYTAILLTDAESFSKKPETLAILNNWTQYNGGKVTLYAMGVNGDNKSSTLELLATFNKGKLFTAPTFRSMKRKMLKMMKAIQNPIAKNISCKAIHKSPQSHIQLYPKSALLPHLYLDQPYVILGESDTLDDFILFVQGKFKDRWMNIKKTVSFVNARKGGKPLKEEWAVQQANDLYEKYIADENPKHLAEAKELLEPFDFQVALQ